MSPIHEAHEQRQREQRDRDRDDLLTFRYDHLLDLLKGVKDDLKEIGAKAAAMELRLAIIETKALVWGIVAGLVTSAAVQLAISVLSRKL